MLMPINMNPVIPEKPTTITADTTMKLKMRLFIFLRINKNNGIFKPLQLK